MPQERSDGTWNENEMSRQNVTLLIIAKKVSQDKYISWFLVSQMNMIYWCLTWFPCYCVTWVSSRGHDDTWFHCLSSSSSSSYFVGVDINIEAQVEASCSHLHSSIVLVTIHLIINRSIGLYVSLWVLLLFFPRWVCLSAFSLSLVANFFPSQASSFFLLLSFTSICAPMYVTFHWIGWGVSFSSSLSTRHHYEYRCLALVFTSSSSSSCDSLQLVCLWEWLSLFHPYPLRHYPDDV